MNLTNSPQSMFVMKNEKIKVILHNPISSLTLDLDLLTIYFDQSARSINLDETTGLVGKARKSWIFHINRYSPDVKTLFMPIFKVCIMSMSYNYSKLIK